MKKKKASARLTLEKKIISPLGEQQAFAIRGGGASEVDPFTCLSQVKCSNSKLMYTCKC